MTKDSSGNSNPSDFSVHSQAEKDKKKRGFGGTFNPLHVEFLEGLLVHDPENPYGCDDFVLGRFERVVAEEQTLYSPLFEKEEEWINWRGEYESAAAEAEREKWKGK